MRIQITQDKNTRYSQHGFSCARAHKTTKKSKKKNALF
jgi:hypothetical protein